MNRVASAAFGLVTAQNDSGVSRSDPVVIEGREHQHYMVATRHYCLYLLFFIALRSRSLSFASGLEMTEGGGSPASDSIINSKKNVSLKI